MNKSIKFILFAIFTTAFSNNIYGVAKYFAKGEIHLLDGSQINCVIRTPINGDDKKIIYKADWESKEKQKIESDKIDYLVLKSTSGSMYLKYTPFYRIKKDGKRKLTDYFWGQIRMSCTNITTFVFVAEVTKNKFGTIETRYRSGTGQYAIQRTGEKYPTEGGFVTLRSRKAHKSVDKNRKKVLLAYFEDDPEALNFINSKERLTQKDVGSYLQSICVKE